MELGSEYGPFSHPVRGKSHFSVCASPALVCVCVHVCVVEGGGDRGSVVSVLLAQLLHHFSFLHHSLSAFFCFATIYCTKQIRYTSFFFCPLWKIFLGLTCPPWEWAYGSKVLASALAFWACLRLSVSGCSFPFSLSLSVPAAALNAWNSLSPSWSSFKAFTRPSETGMITQQVHSNTLVPQWTATP